MITAHKMTAIPRIPVSVPICSKMLCAWLVANPGGISVFKAKRTEKEPGPCPQSGEEVNISQAGPHIPERAEAIGAWEGICV
jgi:hypothetical protein